MKIHQSQIDNVDQEPTRIPIRKQKTGKAQVHPKGLSKLQRQRLQTCRKVRPTESRLQ